MDWRNSRRRHSASHRCNHSFGLEIELYLQRAILESGEKIVWKGKPEPGASVRMTWFELIFGLFFFGFAVFWTVGATVTGGLFGVFGIPFMAVGGWMLTKPIRTRRRARKTYYATTNRHVLIMKRDEGYRVDSVYAHKFNHFSRKDKGDGSGSIRFRKSTVRGRNSYYLITGFSDGLWGVQDVRGADRALSKMRERDVAAG